jgi:CHAT domain-containing protein
LVVVSDGLLNYVPLSALPHPRTADPAGGYRPLVLTHEVVCVPSLAAMVAIGERSSKRAEQSPSGGERRRSRIAVLADPVFTADDPRVGAAPAAARPARVQPPSADANLRGTRQGVGSLPRLLASREEASSIVRAAPGTDVTVTTGFAVDRAKTLSALEDSYQVVHLATHGILNDEHPLLSGIVTSLVDERGVRQDGFLRAQDVYDTHVGAEVVVLSACETALGRLLRGEGITGLVHAFLHAGADSIVASRWRVEDAATQQLMAEFYRSLLVDGASVSAALRMAQIQLLKSRPTSAPFFWAAFEVQGLSPRLAPQKP